jgi:ATP-dependent exoDNAse (exonuclease V) alpha subunit
VSRAIAAAVGRPARPGGGASAQSRIAGIEVLPEYLEVLDQIRKGTPLILVTGGAGTGKSTFIRWLEERYRGEILLCAPTGIAALTIGGRTIHSLCKFPPAYILPSDIRIDRKSPVRSAKVLVIDEISMVSSNLLDAVNLFLQKNREDERPFGGITVVLVGDLFQLPPIVTSETRPLFEAK